MNKVVEHIKGDKIVVLRGQYKGQRGTILDTAESNVRVQLSDDTVMLPTSYLQNYSNAARKAWKTRPVRATGRPKDPTLEPKKMVSLRLDASLWKELGEATELQLIRSREAAVNHWIREKLDELWQKHDAVDKTDE
jgi:hypothetical protein